MATADVVQEAVDKYRGELKLYEDLGGKVESILRELLDEKSIAYHAINHRTKDIEHFRMKASGEVYDDPSSQIFDLAGIRVITLLESDVKKVCDVVEKIFSIDPKHYVDKAQELGSNKFGYRSVHYVCKLPPERTSLLEYNRFQSLPFEVQIRSILQHAWADIEHNRGYKFGGVLPDRLVRRFALVSGLLELADREFNDLSTEIDAYRASVAQDVTEGKLGYKIDTTSLKEYLLQKFRKEVEAGLMATNFGVHDSFAEEIIEELSDYGMATLEELDKTIPKDSRFGAGYDPPWRSTRNFLCLLRDAMIIHDSRRYFDDAWQWHWRGLSPSQMEFYASYGVPIYEIFERYKMKSGWPYMFVEEDGIGESS